jgi:hypothetical protein
MKRGYQVSQAYTEKVFIPWQGNYDALVLGCDGLSVYMAKNAAMFHLHTLDID